MNRVLIRALMIALLMVSSAAAALYMTPPDRSNEPMAVKLDAWIPEAFGDWKVDRSIVPIPMSADVESAVYSVYDAVLGRTYVNSRGQRIMLSVGYSRQQGGVQKPHWQEICYRAQGFAVSNLTRGSATVAEREIPVTRLVAKQGPRVEFVTYWLTLGDHVVANRTDRLTRLIRMGLNRETTDGYLMRISSLNDDADAAFGEHIEFAEALLAAVSDEKRRVLVGMK